MSATLRQKIVQAPAAAVVLGLIALISVWAGQPFLAPSLASATFVQILTPEVRSAKAWPMAAGQLCGLAGGFAGVYAAGAGGAPPFTHDHPLVLARVAAVTLAAVVTGALQLASKAPNAAGAALALVLALGSETPTWTGAGRLVAGIALVTAFGEAFRQIILRLGPRRS